jgi:acyl carrier protein
MTHADDLRALVLELLVEIAPDAEGVAIADDAPLREELDLDSLDVQNLVAALAERTGVEIPEREYGVLDTLGGCVAYLEEHAAT